MTYKHTADQETRMHEIVAELDHVNHTWQQRDSHNYRNTKRLEAYNTRRAWATDQEEADVE
jgi:hypothetical protein